MATIFQLVYDIPSIYPHLKPCNILRPYGVWINGSVWIMPESSLNSADVQAMIREFNRHVGVEWFTLPFDAAAMGDITRLVTRNLTREIRDTVRSCQATCELQSLRMQTSQLPAVEAAKLHRKKTAPVIKQMGKRVLEFRRAAEKFGVTGNTIGVTSALSTLDSIKTVMMERAKQFLTAAAELEGIEPGSLMAKAARKGAVPPCIFADYLQDRGRDATAEKIRENFPE